MYEIFLSIHHQFTTFQALNQSLFSTRPIGIRVILATSPRHSTLFTEGIMSQDHYQDNNSYSDYIDYILNMSPQDMQLIHEAQSQPIDNETALLSANGDPVYFAQPGIQDYGIGNYQPNEVPYMHLTMVSIKIASMATANRCSSSLHPSIMQAPRLLVTHP